MTFASVDTIPTSTPRAGKTPDAVIAGAWTTARLVTPMPFSDICDTCGHKYHEGRCPVDELIASCDCSTPCFVPCWCVRGDE